MANKRQNLTAFAYDKRGTLLAVGRNSYVKTHPLQAKYARRAGRPLAVFIHAEIAALVKARGKVFRIVVMRFDSKGRAINAKPCEICQLALHDYGVKHIEHT